MATMSFNPQTPQSSASHNSPSTADHFSSHNSSMTSITTLPTPAHSVNGHSAADASHDSVMMADDFSNKRKRPFDDVGDQEQKKVHLEDPRRLGIENLHLDVGEKYLLCRTPLSISSPRLTDDLFEAFGLTGIAAEVARVKPNGEKNALRKTYKGHIKTLGVNGHFDAHKKDPMAPDGFMAMVAVPEADWHVHEVAGKEVEAGLSDRAQADLAKATTMAKGIIPKGFWDSSVLGDLAPNNVTKKPNQPATPGTPATAATAKPNKLQPSQADRVRRHNKKRSFQDSNVEGSGEGYTDDDAAGDVGGSAGEGEERAAKLKKRKQNTVGASSLNNTSRPNYGGAVGS